MAVILLPVGMCSVHCYQLLLTPVVWFTLSPLLFYLLYAFRFNTPIVFQFHGIICPYIILTIDFYMQATFLLDRELPFRFFCLIIVNFNVKC